SHTLRPDRASAGHRRQADVAGSRPAGLLVLRVVDLGGPHSHSFTRPHGASFGARRLPHHPDESPDPGVGHGPSLRGHLYPGSALYIGKGGSGRTRAVMGGKRSPPAFYPFLPPLTAFSRPRVVA